MLFDLALNSAIQRATPDESGKRVGDAGHRNRVKTMGVLAELVRHRRAFWGRRWIETARKAVRSKTSRYTHGFSPLRNRAYVVGATFESKEEREPLMSFRGRHAMQHHGATSALCLTADPYRILRTFQHLCRAARGRVDDELASDRVLDVSIAYLER